ncbi:ABC transporter ATP-binding protein [Gordonia sp. X0973]|uniref:ABC transporter transmembrane domain-containing protein n=1 Tax=Gordonia sp. X0973 TaxID=2742602 RepID=UPI000F52E585|nr:ABC transporter ATP-binding protein [Gordonia sp. X0973]QKT08485.1 ABC transporter ATP-binding protein [Gordonia sp. X0973]
MSRGRSEVGRRNFYLVDLVRLCLSRRLLLIAAAIVLAQSASIAFELLLPVLYGRLIDGGLLTGNASHAMRIGAWMLAAVAAQAVVSYGAVRLVAQASIMVGTTLRRRLVHGVVAGAGERAGLEAGGIVTRASRDVMGVQALFSNALGSWYTAAALSVFGLVTLFLVAPRSAPLATCFTVLFGVVGYVLARRMAPHIRTILRVSDRVNTAFSDRIRGRESLRALPRFTSVVDPFSGPNKKLRDEELGLGSILALITPSSTVITTAGAITVIATGAAAVQAGSLQIGELSASITIFLQVLFGVSSLLASLMSLPIHLASAERVHAVVHGADGDAPAPVTAPDGREYLLRVEDLHVTDPATGRRVLDLDELDIAAGSRVGIAGPMGSGKSVLARLLAGLAVPEDGRVVLIDTSTGAAVSPLGVCGYLAQEPYLTTGTIRSNLYPAKTSGHGDDNAIAALQAASIDALVLRRGLDAPVSGGGAEFSGGERQRLALAAALHQSRGLVVLDDPVSAVDPATRTRITDALFDDETEGRRPGTLVVATTDPRILSRCDVVVYLDAGSAADVGTHRELRDRHDAYRILVDSYSDEEVSPR